MGAGTYGDVYKVRRAAGRAGELRAGYALCVLLRELAPGPASSSFLLTPSSSLSTPPPLQARDTVTSELAAVKIVKLDPGEGREPGPQRWREGRARRGRARCKERRVAVSEAPAERQAPGGTVGWHLSGLKRGGTLCPFCRWGTELRRRPS